MPVNQYAYETFQLLETFSQPVPAVLRRNGFLRRFSINNKNIIIIIVIIKLNTTPKQTLLFHKHAKINNALS